MEFNLSQAIASPSLGEGCYLIDVLGKVVLEEMETLSPPLDPLESCMIGNCGNVVDPHPNEEREVYEKILNSTQPYLPRQ